jgi:hypothetical protein
VLAALGNAAKVKQLLKCPSPAPSTWYARIAGAGAAATAARLVLPRPSPMFGDQYAFTAGRSSAAGDCTVRSAWVSATTPVIPTAMTPSANTAISARLTENRFAPIVCAMSVLPICAMPLRLLRQCSADTLTLGSRGWSHIVQIT